MPIAKRPCANCPFRCDGAGIELHPGRIESIVSELLSDDSKTFVCHKTLDKERMTCAGAVGLMSKLDRLPVIARIGLALDVISQADIEASAAMVIEPRDLALPSTDCTD
ncbi:MULTISPECIES: DUF6283 family protein [Delftia]|uniref:Uncharacterized protein n=1 Tax=Delftia lacustris TaxID=558537 RepID=A0A1H3MVJ8_9BURK|nr:MULTISPECIES: DUF6283 family protein [Delftia]SDY80727.1 hypothetical protein SAMN05421547_10864 [Delftia lacustris]